MGNDNSLSQNVNASAWGPSHALNLRSGFVGRVRGVVAGAGPLDYRHISSDGEVLGLPSSPVVGSHQYVRGYVALYEGGGRVRPGPSIVPPQQVGGGARGEVRGMSRASRRRLRQKLLEMAWRDYLCEGKGSASGRSAFLTLTYPGQWDDFKQWQSWKVHLKRFRERLRVSGFRPLGVIWKLEFQKRGAPHFHLILWWSQPVRFAAFQAWARRNWAGAVSAATCEERHKHEKWGAKVVPVYGSAAAAQKYLSKYVSKGGEVPPEIEGGTGRCWGVWWSPPDGHVLTLALTSRSEWFDFLRRVRRWGRDHWLLRSFRLGVVYGDADSLMQLFRGLAPSPVACERVSLPGLHPHLIL